MPLVTAPNIIEVSDFTGGFRPDAEPSNVPPNALLDVSNLLLDVASGALETRKGYSRVSTTMGTGFVVRSLHRYNRLVGTTTGEFLIAVVTSGAATQVWRIRLSDGDTLRIDGGAAFTSHTGIHWGATVNDTFYGGGGGLKMYAWNPDDGWDATVATPVAGVNDFLEYTVDVRDPAGDGVCWDFAFTQGYRVLYTDPVTLTEQAYSAARTVGHDAKDKNQKRAGKWEASKRYEKGDIVTRKSAYDDGVDTGATSYIRAYKCRKDHKSDATDRPGDGTGTLASGAAKWTNFWKPLLLARPRDDNGEITEDWDLIPTAATTSVGTWHGERLFLRYDGSDPAGKSILQYSAPSKPVEGSDIGELMWSPTDFRVGQGKQATGSGEGEGGGWMPIRTGDGDPITALFSFGYYLLIFKRRSTHVLSGLNEATWSRRELHGTLGAVGPRAVAEHEGLVYFLSDEGLFYTDGTQVLPVPGSEVVREYIRSTASWSGELSNAAMWSYDNYLWFTLPGSGKTLAYESVTKTFWVQSFEAGAAVMNRASGKTQLYFGEVGDAVALVHRYGAADTDDDGAATPGTAAISWLARLAWWPFGVLREDRRIRRIWALVRGATGATGTLVARRNFSDTVVWTKNTAPTTTVGAYLEGQVMPDSFAANLAVTGSKAPMALLGAAVETQPRRVRYHR